jgi:hypothetical protein
MKKRPVIDIHSSVDSRNPLPGGVGYEDQSLRNSPITPARQHTYKHARRKFDSTVEELIANNSEATGTNLSRIRSSDRERTEFNLTLPYRLAQSAHEAMDLTNPSTDLVIKYAKTIYDGVAIAN